MKKIDRNYIGQISRACHEQSSFLEANLGNWVIDEDFRVLEVGIGGGEILNKLLTIIGDKNKIYGIDIEKKFVKIGNAVIGENATKQNVCHMNFKDNYFNIIYVSSLIHEVYTYGHNGNFGIGAIKTAFEEMLRILKTEGTILYRDVLTPKEDTFMEVIYRGLSFRVFVVEFLKVFLNSKLGHIHKNRFIHLDLHDNTVIFGSARLHRELQKHYVLCMDNIGLFSFGNIKNPKKSFQEMQERFSLMYANDQLSLIKNIKKWLKREGSESYIYLSVEELNNLLSVITRTNNYQLKIDSFIYERKDEHNFIKSTLIGKAQKEGIQYLLIKKI